MTIRQVLEVMDHYRFTTIPLLGENGEYVGTISEGDLLFYLKNNQEIQIKDLNTVSILKVIRNKDEIKDMRFHRLNDTTYISRKANGEENE